MNIGVIAVVFSIAIYGGARQNMRENKDFFHVILPLKLQRVLFVNYRYESIPFHMAVFMILSAISIAILIPSVLIERLLHIDLELFHTLYFALLFLIALALTIYIAICDVVLRKRR